MAGIRGQAGAAEQTPGEKANVQTVNNFCAAWPSHNLDRIMSFLRKTALTA